MGDAFLILLFLSAIPLGIWAWHRQKRDKIMAAAQRGGATSYTLQEIRAAKSNKEAVAFAGPYITPEQVEEFLGLEPTTPKKPDPLLPVNITAEIRDAILLQTQSLPPPNVLKLISDAGSAILDRAEYEDNTQARATVSAITTAMVAYVRALPSFEPAIFQQPLFTATDPSFTKNVIEPFKKEGLPQEIKSIALDFYNRCAALGKNNNLVWPQQYDRPADIAQVYFKGSPLQPLMNLQVPLHLNERKRFNSHWVIGATDSGKSNHLSHLINDDIKNYSVMVMDSQYRLIDGLARLPDITPILVGASNPIPMNIYKLGNTAAILSHALSGTDDFTPAMAGALPWIVKAAEYDDQPNLNAIERLIKQWPAYPRYIEKADPDTKAYFRDDWKNLHEATVTGISNRLAAFKGSSQLINQMFNHPECHFNLYQLFQDKSFILIDLNQKHLSAGQIFTWGRLFLALVYDVIRERSGKDEDFNQRAIVYIDETANYVSKTQNDQNLLDILDRGRKQRVAMVIAAQRDGQLHSAVTEALEDRGYRTYCLAPGQAELWEQLRRDPDGKYHFKKIPFYNAEFKYSGRITDKEYTERYPAPKGYTPPPPTPMRYDRKTAK